MTQKTQYDTHIIRPDNVHDVKRIIYSIAVKYISLDFKAEFKKDLDAVFNLLMISNFIKDVYK